MASGTLFLRRGNRSEKFLSILWFRGLGHHDTSLQLWTKVAAKIASYDMSSHR